jgi:hypothetical protein
LRATAADIAIDKRGRGGDERKRSGAVGEGEEKGRKGVKDGDAARGLTSQRRGRRVRHIHPNVSLFIAAMQSSLGWAVGQLRMGFQA